MVENLGNLNPSGNPQQGTNAKKGKKFKGTSRVVLIYIFGFVTAGLVIYGSLLLSIHPKPLKFALACIFVASISGGLALRMGLINRRISHHIAKGAPTGAAAAVVLLSGIGCCIAWRLEKPDPSPQQAVIIIPQPDYIEGTEVARKQLEQIFPFGYAIIYLNEENQKEIHEFRSKLSNWRINWDLVKIEPNFESGNVTFTTPNIDANAADKGSVLVMSNSTFVVNIRLQKGVSRVGPIQFGAVPVPYFAILNDNQRKPVFAIGFRIPTKEL
jgi:hypothetical protein